MPIGQRDAGGVARTPVTWTQRDASGALRTLQTIWQRGADGVLRKIFDAMRATAAPTRVTGTANSTGAVTITTASTTVTAPGATGFAWATSADPSIWSAVDPTSPTTSFRAMGIGPTEVETATFVCTVTFPSGTANASVTAVARNNRQSLS